MKDSVENEVLPLNKEELVNAILRAQKDVSLEMIEVLLANMPQCMKVVIKANSDSTRW
jgi:hypothetical protein